MKNLAFILLFCIPLLATQVHSQTFGSNVIGVEQSDSEPLNNTFKPDVSITLGSSFTSFAPGFNAFGTYVMPEITLPVTNKFAVRTGIGYSTMFFNSPENTGSIFNHTNMQYGTVYVSGLYRLNPKLTIAGTVYKTFDVSPRNNEVTSPAFDFSNEGVVIDVEYKVNENFRINAEFGYHKQSPYNYYYRPGGFNAFGSPFRNDAFAPSF